MDQVRRKRIRLPASNYEAGWYFVTICTDHRTNFLANVTPTVGADDSVRPCVALEGYTSRLTPIGLAVRECLERLTDTVHGVVVDKYIIMPNHVHAIICLSAGTGGQSRPPLQIPPAAPVQTACPDSHTRHSTTHSRPLPDIFCDPRNSDRPPAAEKPRCIPYTHPHFFKIWYH